MPLLAPRAEGGLAEGVGYKAPIGVLLRAGLRRWGEAEGPFGAATVAGRSGAGRGGARLGPPNAQFQGPNGAKWGPVVGCAPRPRGYPFPHCGWLLLLPRLSLRCAAEPCARARMWPWPWRRNTATGTRLVHTETSRVAGQGHLVSSV